MTPVEEFRYLVLAVQREGNRLLARRLRTAGLTPSQAEVLRVLQDRAPLMLSDLGELLVCETGTSPSRLVDRLVRAGLVSREVGTDRRSVTLRLTGEGERKVRQVEDAERALYDELGPLLEGRHLDETLSTLRAVAGAFPAGRAVALRAGRPVAGG
jgi:DNA-binding MarR family transcriptional regulator